MRLAILITALMLAGCASAPKPQVHHTIPAKIIQPAAPTEAKPATFKQRWFDRFIKHKSK